MPILIIHWEICFVLDGKDLAFGPTTVSLSTLLQFRPRTLTFDPTLNKIKNLHSKNKPLMVHIRPYLILLVHTTGEGCF